MNYNTVRKFAPFAITHGFTRKFLQLNGNVTVCDHITDKQEHMYVTTKGLICAVGVVSNIYLWPMNAFKDVYRLEAHIRGEYKKPTDIIEHLVY